MPNDERPVYDFRRPPLAPYQTAALFCTERYALIEASTKSGKTHGALAWLVEQAFRATKLHRNFYWVAPVYTQSKVAYRRLLRALPQAARKPNATELTLTLPNTSVIVFRSGENPDNLYSDDVDAAVIDEASRLREESWHAVRSTLTATRGPVRIIGNVKGRRNWFYNLARRAEAGEPDMRFARITAADAVAAGIIAADEVADAKRTLPEAVFRELFEAQPSDDVGNPFGLKDILACLKPISTLGPVVFGCDLAKSVDYTVLVGLDYFGNVCRFTRFQKPWKETIEALRAEVGDVRCIVDSTGVGDPVLDQLQRGDGTMRPNFEGFQFSAPSKQRLMEGLAVGIQQHAVGVIEGPMRLELESFEYTYSTRAGGGFGGVRYSAPDGMHDDIVCALALAWSAHAFASAHAPAASWPASESASNPGQAPSWFRAGN